MSVNRISHETRTELFDAFATEPDIGDTVSLANSIVCGDHYPFDVCGNMSPTIRTFATHLRAPAEMLSAQDTHGRRWRRIAPFIPGSHDERLEGPRRVLVEHWMWECLGWDVVPSWVPSESTRAWAAMLRDRSLGAAFLACELDRESSAAEAHEYARLILEGRESVAETAVFAVSGAAEASGDPDGFWRLADPARVLFDMLWCDRERQQRAENLAHLATNHAPGKGELRRRQPLAL